MSTTLAAVDTVDDSFRSLAEVLRERRRLIADRDFYQRDPASHLEQLKAISEKIVHLHALLPRPVNGELAHFMERCSYDKALAWLEENL